VHTPLAAGWPCVDGNQCNGDEQCDGAGTCQAGTPPIIDDGNTCTVDSCDQQQGVIHTPAATGSPCPNSDKCDGDETCNGSGVCVDGPLPVIDDGDPCTADACDSLLGVTHTPIAPGTGSCPDNPPIWPAGTLFTLDGVGCASASLSWTDAIDDVAVTSYHIYLDGQLLQKVEAASNGLFGALGLTCAKSYTFTVVAEDGIGNLSSNNPTLVVNTPSFPVDPAQTAPASDPTELSFIGDVSFLFEGANPAQTGVVAGTIERGRAAVLRGKVSNCGGQPLEGIVISVANHPEFGQTRTRADGMFDMAVNGGGPLTVRYRSPGYMPVDRTTSPRWEDYEWLPDVVMTPYDDTVTAVELNAAQMQVAQSSVITDSDGVRQAILLFPAGTTADLVFSCDGNTTQPLSSMSVRATEYTVGACGPAAMPAELPEQSAYTYAVELSVDEAILAGAEWVQFNQPVVLYLDDFLSLPVGTPVPNGFYDRCISCWTASDSGVVVKIVNIVGNVAELDVDGDGLADGAGALAAVGITDAEREQLAQLYGAGKSLWRIPTTHFSPWDGNLGVEPAGPPPDVNDPNINGQEDDSCKEEGSIIEVSNTVLQQMFAATGTQFQLHYRSDRTAGFAASSNVHIPLTGPSPPANLKRVDLTIEIAGQLFEQSFTNAASQIYDFAWDGLDGFGRIATGLQPVVTEVSYVYDTVYQQVDSFGGLGEGLALVPARTEYSLSRTWSGYIQAPSTPSAVTPGFSISGLHTYDTRANVLLFGNGSRRSMGDSSKETQAELQRLGLAATIETIVGTGPTGDAGGGYSGDGGAATAAMLNAPSDVAVAPDGTLYIADNKNCRIRKVDPQGVISTFAGSPQFIDDTYCDTPVVPPDHVGNPDALALSKDGSLIVLSSFKACAGCVRTGAMFRVDQNGTLDRLTGDAQQPCASLSPDGTAAADVRLCWGSYGIATDDSCNIYYGGLSAVMRIGPDGRVYRVAGTNAAGFSGDGGPARLAQLDDPMDIVLDDEGGLYVADWINGRIRYVSNAGVITTFAGNGNFWEETGDGGPALSAALASPRHLARGPDGSIWLSADWGTNHIRRIDSEGTIRRAVGHETWTGYDNDGYPATQALINASNFAFGPDGSLYIAEGNNHRIRRVAPPRAVPHSDIYVPSPDGSEVYVFTEKGRHLRTLDALTGVKLKQYAYSADGYVIAITDENDLTTTIARLANNQVSAITSPYGHKTIFAHDADGNVTTITNPAGEKTTMSYYPGGLMKTLTRPKGNKKTYTYDAQGRLTKAKDDAGGFKSLVRTEQGDESTVKVTTALGRKRTYAVEHQDDGLAHNHWRRRRQRHHEEDRRQARDHAGRRHHADAHREARSALRHVRAAAAAHH